MEEHAPDDVHGTSLSAIQGYLRGDGEPSVAFLRQAAVLLVVREPWLISGHGTPTEEGEAGRRDGGEAEHFGVSTAVYDALGVPTKLKGGGERFWGSAVWAPIARHTALRLYQRRPMWELLEGGVDVLREDPDARWERAVQDTATAIAAPLKALGMDGSQLELRQVGDYVSAMALTLQQVMYRYVPGTDDTKGIPPLSRALLEGLRVPETEDEENGDDT